ncbi:MAG: hypothetical protein Q7R34_08580 [Dehalococcoidia bacterium]|nr:hypothetical protein [Dehalococcoidia bacterium]
MFNISLVIGSSVALAMLFGAIAIANLYPNNPSTPFFVKSMITWFFALGPLHWLESYIHRAIFYKHDKSDYSAQDNYKKSVGAFLAAFVVIAIIASVLLFRACSMS